VVGVVVGVMPWSRSSPFGGRGPLGAMVGAHRPMSMSMVGAMSMVGGVDVLPMVSRVPGELGSLRGFPVCRGLPMG